MSDQFLAQCCFYIQNVKTSSAYWHFNTALLSDRFFREAFRFLQILLRKNKSSFSSVQQWWDIRKTLIQQFCKQYTRNVTKYITSCLQDLETEIQTLLGCTGDQGSVEVLKSKKAAVANQLGISAQGALVRSLCEDALECRNDQRKVIHCRCSEDGSPFTAATDIRRYATQFYKGLFNTELVEDPELDTSFLSDLPQVEASTNSQLDA